MQGSTNEHTYVLVRIICDLYMCSWEGSVQILTVDGGMLPWGGLFTTLLDGLLLDFAKSIFFFLWSLHRNLHCKQLSRRIHGLNNEK